MRHRYRDTGNRDVQDCFHKTRDWDVGKTSETETRLKHTRTCLGTVTWQDMYMYQNYNTVSVCLKTYRARDKSKTYICTMQFEHKELFAYLRVMNALMPQRWPKRNEQSGFL